MGCEEMGCETHLTITIDGPAGAGKSTCALGVARRLGLLLLDTGALYRGLALAALERGVPTSDGPAVAKTADAIRLELVAGAVSERPRLCLDGRDRSADIRRPDVSQGASQVSAHPEVRDALLTLQRSLADRGGFVAEGRDTGTVVFPRADVKIFLTASVDERTRRRHLELTQRGHQVSREAVRRELEARDKRDSNRPVAPLRPAEDAIVVDTTGMDLDQVVQRLVSIVRTRCKSAPVGAEPD